MLMFHFVHGNLPQPKKVTQVVVSFDADIYFIQIVCNSRVVIVRF